MSLRYREEPEERLSPEEAQAFLRVHAEFEADAQEGPRIEDLAESLQIPVEEARRILQEARRRSTAAVPLRRRRRNAPYGVVTAGVATLASLALLSFRLSTTPGLKRPVILASAPAAIIAPPAAMTASPLPMSAPSPVPDGFSIDVVSPSGSTFEMDGNPARLGTDYRNLNDADAASLRGRLADAVLTMLRDAPRDDLTWRDSRNLTVGLRIGGDAVRFTVPLEPFTLPLEGNESGRESLRQTLEKVFAAGWPSVVRSMPR